MHRPINVDYLQLRTESCRRNFRLFNIFFKLYNCVILKKWTIWDCVYTSLHILYNNTATLITASHFNLIKIKYVSHEDTYLQYDFKCSLVLQIYYLNFVVAFQYLGIHRAIVEENIFLYRNFIYEVLLQLHLHPHPSPKKGHMS